MKSFRDVFEKTPNNEIIAVGTLSYNPTGIPIPGSIKWVAKKGMIGDFAVYVGEYKKSINWIKSWGTKANREEVKKLIPDIDDELLEKYYRD